VQGFESLVNKEIQTEKLINSKDKIIQSSKKVYKFSKNYLIQHCLCPFVGPSVRLFLLRISFFGLSCCLSYYCFYLFLSCDLSLFPVFILSTFTYVSLSVTLSLCLYAFLLSVCLSYYLSVFLSAFLSFCLIAFLLSFCRSFSQSLFVPICLFLTV
jgi:hypothetical protein